MRTRPLPLSRRGGRPPPDGEGRGRGKGERGGGGGGNKALAGDSCPPLRVAICHPDLGIGGAERLIVDAAMELRARGHSVTVFTAHHDPSHCFEETLSGAFPVRVFGDFLPRSLFGRLHALCAYIRCAYVAWALVLTTLFHHDAFDVALVDQVSAAIPILRLTGAKILFYCHFPDLLLVQKRSWLRSLYRAPLNWWEETTTGLADAILVNSSFTKSTFAATFVRLHKRGVEPEVLFPAVDPSQFDTHNVGVELHARAQVDGAMEGSLPNGIDPSSQRIFLSINRFERKKNIGLAIEAFARLQASLPPDRARELAPQLRLVIAGGYDPRVVENRQVLEELKALVDRLGVGDRVVFLPSFSTEMKGRLLAACCCVVYTPENEHFGMVPLEAMASRRPVIACGSGGPVESIIDGETGFLCHSSPDHFARAMLKLLDDKVSRDMGEKARARVVNKFSRGVFGAKLEAAVLQLCGRQTGLQQRGRM